MDKSCLCVCVLKRVRKSESLLLVGKESCLEKDGTVESINSEARIGARRAAIGPLAVLVMVGGRASSGGGRGMKPKIKMMSGGDRRCHSPKAASLEPPIIGTYRTHTNELPAPTRYMSFARPI